MKTVISQKLGEQLICKLNPTSDLVKKQLSQLREQWQNLRQMAANQTRALGAARNLQEFNKKVDKLEAWIKQKVKKKLNKKQSHVVFAFLFVFNDISTCKDNRTCIQYSIN